MQTPLLDDPEKIKSVDKSDMLKYAVHAARHYREAADLAEAIMANYPAPQNIIVAGMGGSAIGGDLLKDWAKDKLAVPIEVNREYHLPAYADNHTLVLITSYSGDTEETLSNYLDALKRKCMIFCISSGGALLADAQKRGVPYLKVPGGMPPRAALPYLFVPMLMYLQKAGLVSGALEELDEATEVMEQISVENDPRKLTRDSYAKSVATSIGATAPAVYGFDAFRSVAQRFKQQFNENSKSASKWEFFPELDHNEIVGWESCDEQCRYFSIIFIRDPAGEPIEIASRIDTTKQIMERKGLIVFDWEVQGKSLLAKMLSTVVLGDFISVYLAVMRGSDPTPVATINYLKDTLKQNGVKENILAALEKL